MSSKKSKSCPSIQSDEINQCDCSDTDSASESPVVISEKHDRKKVLCVDLSSDDEPPRKKKKKEVGIGESSNDSGLDILKVQEGRVQREVEIVRVEKRVRRSVDIEVIKVIPGITSTQVQKVHSGIVDSTGDIRIVHVQGSAHAVYRGQCILHKIDLTDESTADDKGKFPFYQILAIFLDICTCLSYFSIVYILFLDTDQDDTLPDIVTDQEQDVPKGSPLAFSFHFLIVNCFDFIYMGQITS